MEGKRAGALGLREKCVAGTESKPIEIADDGADDNFDGEEQIGNHAANDGSLSRILLAEKSFIGFGGDEQLGDDRSDAAKMAGAGDTVKTVSEVFDFDKCGAAGRVHFFDGWGKDDAGTVSLSEGAVSIQGAWVAGEVLAGTELGGVDENADGDVAAGCARGTDERSVAGMERTHGGHESDRVAGEASKRPGPLTQFGGGMKDFHQALRSSPTLRRVSG